MYVFVILRTTKQNVEDPCLGTSTYTLHAIGIAWYNIVQQSRVEVKQSIVYSPEQLEIYLVLHWGSP